jgi:sugar/nucleoside kinase (ribokinase family)
MPSADEATALTGLDDLAAAADAFRAMGAKACVIKAGAAGAVVAMGDERHRIPAHLIEPVDTTSCGDSFCAGFIAALARGWTVLDACRFAATTAALVAQGLGTLGKLQGFDQTVEAMGALPLRGPD